MDSCCAVHPVHARQRRTILIVVWLNAAMFGIELVAGLVAHSTALLADSVDMLGDAIVYGFSLYAIGRGPIWQSRAALLKGLIMAGFGVVVLGEVGTKLLRGVTPDAEIMWTIAALAFAVNAVAFSLLWRHRADDINMRSVWLCSRNDVAANAGVLVAALGVSSTGSAWPDILVGLAIAALFGLSAVGVIRHAIANAGRSASTPRSA